MRILHISEHTESFGPSAPHIAHLLKRFTCRLLASRRASSERLLKTRLRAAKRLAGMLNRAFGH